MFLNALREGEILDLGQIERDDAGVSTGEDDGNTVIGTKMLAKLADIFIERLAKWSSIDGDDNH